MSRSTLPLGIICLVVSCVIARNPLAAQTKSKEHEIGTRLVQQLPQNAKTKAEKAEAEKAASAVQLTQAAAPTPAEIHTSLRKPVEVKFEDTPLKEATAFIARSTGTNIVIDEQALTEEGVSVDEPIHRVGKPIAGARLLDRILEPLRLTWIVHDDMVQITTSIAVEDVFVTRTYPVGDILEFVKKHRPEKPAAKDPLTMQTLQFGGFGELYYLSAITVSNTRQTPVFWLMNTLQNFTTGPWQNVDDTGGRMSYANNTLVIRQTYQVQTEIDQLLKALRQFTKDEWKTNVVEIHPPYLCDGGGSSRQKCPWESDQREMPGNAAQQVFGRTDCKARRAVKHRRASLER